MAAFTVWKFEDLGGAERAAESLKDCERGGDREDPRPRRGDLAGGRHSKPSTKHGHEENWRGTGWGALWGVLLGALFFVPVIGGVVGCSDRGDRQDDPGLRHHQGPARDNPHPSLTPGSSALFVVTEEGDLDRVGERFRAGHHKLIATNLTDAERQVLLETFGNR